MSHSAPENDDFPSDIPVPDLFDIDYPKTVKSAFEKLTRRTDNVGAAIGAFGAPDLAWEQHDESYFVPDVDGTGFPLFLPPVNRAGNIRTALGNVYAKIVGLRSLVTSTVASLNASMAALQTALQAQITTLNNATWGLGLSGELVFAPRMLFGTNTHGDTSYWYQTDRLESRLTAGIRAATASSVSLFLEVPPLPINGTIKYIELNVIGVGDHGTISGMTMPSISLLKIDGFNVTELATASDGSSTPSTYQIPHAVRATLSGSGIRVQTGVWYQIRASGESGSNALPDSFTILNCKIGLG